MMPLMEKLQILGESAKYDVSCSSSGSNRNAGRGNLGATTPSGICHTFTSDGRCISLLKVLMTNDCIHDCLYCVNRSRNDTRKAMFSPDELADITINFYKRNYIEGLFLSSGVYKSSDYTMELMIKAVQKLRNEYHFNGYVHMKIIPGASQEFIYKAGLICDRISENMEFSAKSSLKLLAPQKNHESIVTHMTMLKNQIIEFDHDKKKHMNVPSFAPAGQSTQLIVGATPETDYSLISLSERLYKKMELKRVYYSSYIPVNPQIKMTDMFHAPLLREHRLYQADWLLRFYNYKAEEILDSRNPFLDMEFDQKMAWAFRHMEFFPVEVNTADYESLLRVPGMGVRSVIKIVQARRMRPLSTDDLGKLGVVLKRAKYFITARGRLVSSFSFQVEHIKNKLRQTDKNDEQPLLFDTSQFSKKTAIIAGEP